MAARSLPLDHRLIERRAGAWLARRDSGEWTHEDDEALGAWLDECTAHQVAFLRLERAWENAHRVKALGAGHAPGVVPPSGHLSRSFFFRANGPRVPSKSPARRRTPWRAAAAALVLVFGIGAAAHALHWFRPGNELSTPVGVIASFPLPDGSVVTLNTASRIRVAFGPRERRVVLERGEAYFQVRKNPARPFAVIVGDQRIVDVGTRFSVMRQSSGLRVVVTEGEVEVQSPPDPAHRGDGASSSLSRPPPADIRVPLVAGSVAFDQGGNLLVRKLPLPRVRAMVSWREGYLSFHDTTLAQAVAEFNRYNSRQLVIEDPRVAGIRISGTFRPTNYRAFVRLLHEGYSIDASDTKDGVALSENQ